MKKYFGYPSTCTCENVKHLEHIVDDSVVTCKEIIESIKTVPKNFNKKETTCTANFCILLTFLFITILLLIIVNTYCYHIKHKSKQRVLTYDTSNKLKEIDVNNVKRNGKPKVIGVIIMIIIIDIIIMILILIIF